MVQIFFPWGVKWEKIIPIGYDGDGDGMRNPVPIHRGDPKYALRRLLLKLAGLAVKLSAERVAGLRRKRARGPLGAERWRCGDAGLAHRSARAGPAAWGRS